MKIHVFAVTASLALICLLAVGAPVEPKPARLRLELFVNDLQASKAFYRDVLGFTVEREENDYITVSLGTVQFGLGSAKGLPSGHYFNPELQTARRGLGTEIVLEVPDLEGTFAQVEKSGVKVLSDIKKRPWGQTDFRIADPDGYYLRLSTQ